MSRVKPTNPTFRLYAFVVEIVCTLFLLFYFTLEMQVFAEVSVVCMLIM
jgi:hypothetical protein